MRLSTVAFGNDSPRLCLLEQQFSILGYMMQSFASMKVPTAVSVMERMDIKPGENMKKSLRDIDCQRVSKAEKAAEMMTKEARMKKRGQKRKREDKETETQDSYGPRQF